MLFLNCFSNDINYFLVFLYPRFEVNFDKSPKKFTVQVFISILLKYSDNNLEIVFIIYCNF